MEEIKDVMVTRKTMHGDIFVTRGTILNQDDDGVGKVQILLENSAMDDMTISVKSGIRTISEHSDTALGAAAIAVGKSILGAITKNPSAASRMENGLMKDLSREYSRILEENTPDDCVLWEKKFSNMKRMKLEPNGTVELHEKNGTVFVLTFKSYRKAKKWFEDAKIISGMKSVDT